MGEIGSAFFKIMTEAGIATIGKDKVKNRAMSWGVPLGYEGEIDVMHVCIGFLDQDEYVNSVVNYAQRWKPKELVIHSSAFPGTTEIIQRKLVDLPVIYSPFRGVHSRMGFDMKRYTKYWSVDITQVHEIPKLFPKEMAQCRVRAERWEEPPRSLELAKLLMDVTYYGWLIIFSQHVRVLADRFGVDGEKLWKYTEEIHEFLGNRPTMFFGEGIGGHCVMQDEDLLKDPFLDAVFAHDEYYKRVLPDLKKRETLRKRNP